MELTKAMQILGIAERQQLSEEVTEAIRTALNYINVRDTNIYCGECWKYKTEHCRYADRAKQHDKHIRPTDFCSAGERK